METVVINVRIKKKIPKANLMNKSLVVILHDDYDSMKLMQEKLRKDAVMKKRNVTNTSKQRCSNKKKNILRTWDIKVACK